MAVVYMDSTANLINKISDDLIISRKIHDCYLMYTSKEYYLFKPIDDIYVPISIDISENPDTVETTLLDGAKGKLSNNPTFNGSLQFLKLHLEMIGLTAKTQQDFLYESFYDLAEIYVGERDRISKFKEINNEKLIADIITISKDVERNKQDSVIGELYTTFKNRKGVKKGQRTLGNYLNKEQGIILRKHSHERYKLNKNLNVYDSIDNDEIIELLTDVFGEDNLISTSDVETAVDFISEKLSPTPDIVKFNNVLYDMKQHKIIKPKKPIFTLVESPYNYNPDAKGEIVKDFLKSSLKREDDKETKKINKRLFTSFRLSIYIWK